MPLSHKEFRALARQCGCKKNWLRGLTMVYQFDTEPEAIAFRTELYRVEADAQGPLEMVNTNGNKVWQVTIEL